jgi:AcrR family transcriptional regulator
MPPSDVPSSQDAQDGSAQKRRRILDAAFSVCEERGVFAARMEEVAARAQVSKGTVYRFFASKEDLFLAAIMEGYAQASHESGADREPEAGEGDPAKRLSDRLVGMAKALGVVTPRSRVVYQAWGVVGDSPEAQRRLEQFLTRFHRDRHAEYEQWVREGQQQGAFRSDVDPNVVALSIGALLSGFIYRAAFDPASATPQALLACFDLLLHDVLGYSEDARPTEAPDG